MFNTWLLSKLKEKEWSQADLARASGLTTAAISKYINGRIPDAEALKKIARAFRLPNEQVFEAAGVFPPKSKADEKIEQINHLAESMSEDEKQELLEYIKFRIKIAEEKKDKETENANRNKRRPANAEGHG